MLTTFGKFTRCLRIDHDELLYHMAKKLGVSSSYLSSIELGKRPIPLTWYKKISDLYQLNDREKKNLCQAIHDTVK